MKYNHHHYGHQACIICGILGSWIPGTFFCQALFDNLSRFMCFLGTFLEKKVAIYVFILAKCRDLCAFRHFFGQDVVIYALFQAHSLRTFPGTFLGSQAPKTFMQAWVEFSSNVLGDFFHQGFCFKCFGYCGINVLYIGKYEIYTLRHFCNRGI